MGVVALPQTTQGGMAGGVVRTQILLPITQVLIWSLSVEGSNAQGSLKAQWHSGATEPELDSEDTTPRLLQLNWLPLTPEPIPGAAQAGAGLSWGLSHIWG